MSGKEFHLIKELTYSRLTAICAFEPPFFAYLLCGSLLKVFGTEGIRLQDLKQNSVIRVQVLLAESI